MVALGVWSARKWSSFVCSAHLVRSHWKRHGFRRSGQLGSLYVAVLRYGLFGTPKNLDFEDVNYLDLLKGRLNDVSHLGRIVRIAGEGEMTKDLLDELVGFVKYMDSAHQCLQSLDKLEGAMVDDYRRLQEIAGFCAVSHCSFVKWMMSFKEMSLIWSVNAWFSSLHNAVRNLVAGEQIVYGDVFLARNLALEALEQGEALVRALEIYRACVASSFLMLEGLNVSDPDDYLPEAGLNDAR